MNTRRLRSPIGPLTLVADERALVAIRFGETGGDEQTASSPILDAAQRQLEEYFAGEREDFDLPLAPRGTEFQRAVWSALGGVGFGRTASYAAIAAKVGRPKAVRAVGAANGANPLPIVVPCHRIVGSDGRLTGYAGGLAIKRALLEHEGVELRGDRVVVASQLGLGFSTAAAQNRR